MFSLRNLFNNGHYIDECDPYALHSHPKYDLWKIYEQTTADYFDSLLGSVELALL